MYRVRRFLLPYAVALGLALTLVPAFVATAAASSTYVANCTIYLRTSPYTSATAKALLRTGGSVTVAGTANGGSYSATCGSNVSGSTWFKITAVNGRSTSSLYGVSAVYAASKLFRAPSGSTTTTTTTTTVTTSSWISNCSVRLRATASTS